MSAEFRKCLKLERDRARSRRESAQGSFETAMLSLDQHVESFDDPGKIAMFSDGGAEAERVYSYDESVDGSYYTRRIKVARRRLSRNCPELVEVFNLVVKNGKNRHERKALGKALWDAVKPALLGAIGGGVIALTDGCSSLTPSSKTQSMGVYAIGVPGIAIITKSTQHEDASGGDANAPSQTNPVTTTMTTGK